MQSLPLSACACAYILYWLSSTFVNCSFIQFVCSSIYYKNTKIYNTVLTYTHRLTPTLAMCINIFAVTIKIG